MSGDQVELALPASSQLRLLTNNIEAYDTVASDRAITQQSVSLASQDRVRRCLMEKLPVSCFIIAENEADRIALGIRSVVDWVDEVIVVDGGSTDDTAFVAQREGARVINNSWPGFGQQKRFAESQCKNKWVLNIDSDEVVTLELRRRIEELFAYGQPTLVAYGMPVLLIYPGAIKPRRLARDHWCVRFYDRTIVRFRNSQIHDSVETGRHKVGNLRAPIHHFSIRSFAHMAQKLDARMWVLVRYSEVSSPIKLALRLLTEFPMHFFKYYIIRCHFTGGLHGANYAYLEAKYRTARIRRMLFDHSRCTSQRMIENKGNFE